MKKSKRRSRIWTALSVGIVVMAVGFALIPLPAEWIERFYSRGVYPWVQSWLTPLTNLVSFSVGDVLFVALVLGLPIWWIVRIKSARGRRIRESASLALKSLVALAVVYLAFLALWGFNYERVTLMTKLDYDQTRLNADTRKALRTSTIERLNADSKSAHGSAWPTDQEWQSHLLESFNNVVVGLGNRKGVAPAAAKTSLSDFFLGKTAVSGFTNPFGLEVILNSDLLPIEKPFTLAHEWAHLAGFADESEANFVGFLACARSDLAAIKYSGWLALYSYLPVSYEDLMMGELKTSRESPTLSAEVIADLRAIEERSRRRLSPTVSRVQGSVYDGFLKANRVESGIGSYGLFVRLMLGTRFETEWMPARRG